MLLSLSEQLAQIDNFAGAGDEHTQRESEREGAGDRQIVRQTDNWTVRDVAAATAAAAACNSNWKLLISIKTFDIGAYLCVALSSQLLSNLSRKFFSFPVFSFLVSRFLFLISLAIIHGQLRSAFVLRQQHHLYYSAAPLYDQPARPTAHSACLSFSSAGQSAHRAMRALRRVVSSRAKVKYSLPRDLYYRYEVIDQN